MSKDVCSPCGKVIRTTSDDNLYWLISRDDLIELDVKVGNSSFSDILFDQLRKKSTSIFICKECQKELGITREDETRNQGSD